MLETNRGHAPCGLCGKQAIEDRCCQNQKASCANGTIRADGLWDFVLHHVIRFSAGYPLLNMQVKYYRCACNHYSFALCLDGFPFLCPGIYLKSTPIWVGVSSTLLDLYSLLPALPQQSCRLHSERSIAQAIRKFSN